MSLIRLEDVYKIYGEGEENQVNALDGVTMEIGQGEFVAIIGTSGSGKSTMMNILGCLDVPTRGEYFLDGVPIRSKSQRELPGRHLHPPAYPEGTQRHPLPAHRVHFPRV